MPMAEDDTRHSGVYPPSLAGVNPQHLLSELLKTQHGVSLSKGQQPADPISPPPQPSTSSTPPSAPHSPQIPPSPTALGFSEAERLPPPHSPRTRHQPPPYVPQPAVDQLAHRIAHFTLPLIEEKLIPIKTSNEGCKASVDSLATLVFGLGKLVVDQSDNTTATHANLLHGMQAVSSDVEGLKVEVGYLRSAIGRLIGVDKEKVEEGSNGHANDFAPPTPVSSVPSSKQEKGTSNRNLHHHQNQLHGSSLTSTTPVNPSSSSASGTLPTSPSPSPINPLPTVRIPPRTASVTSISQNKGKSRASEVDVATPVEHQSQLGTSPPELPHRRFFRAHTQDYKRLITPAVQEWADSQKGRDNDLGLENYDYGRNSVEVSSSGRALSSTPGRGSPSISTSGDSLPQGDDEMKTDTFHGCIRAPLGILLHGQQHTTPQCISSAHLTTSSSSPRPFKRRRSDSGSDCSSSDLPLSELLAFRANTGNETRTTAFDTDSFIPPSSASAPARRAAPISSSVSAPNVLVSTSPDTLTSISAPTSTIPTTNTASPTTPRRQSACIPVTLPRAERRAPVHAQPPSPPWVADRQALRPHPDTSTEKLTSVATSTPCSPSRPTHLASTDFTDPPFICSPTHEPQSRQDERKASSSFSLVPIFRSRSSSSLRESEDRDEDPSASEDEASTQASYSLSPLFSPRRPNQYSTLGAVLMSSLDSSGPLAPTTDGETERKEAHSKSLSVLSMIPTPSPSPAMQNLPPPPCIVTEMDLEREVHHDQQMDDMSENYKEPSGLTPVPTRPSTPSLDPDTTINNTLSRMVVDHLDSGTQFGIEESHAPSSPPAPSMEPPSSQPSSQAWSLLEELAHPEPSSPQAGRDEDEASQPDLTVRGDDDDEVIEACHQLDDLDPSMPPCDQLQVWDDAQEGVMLSMERDTSQSTNDGVITPTSSSSRQGTSSLALLDSKERSSLRREHQKEREESRGGVGGGEEEGEEHGVDVVVLVEEAAERQNDVADLEEGEVTPTPGFRSLVAKDGEEEGEIVYDPMEQPAPAPDLDFVLNSLPPVPDSPLSISASPLPPSQLSLPSPSLPNAKKPAEDGKSNKGRAGVPETVVDGLAEVAQHDSTRSPSGVDDVNAQPDANRMRPIPNKRESTTVTGAEPLSPTNRRGDTTKGAAFRMSILDAIGIGLERAGIEKYRTSKAPNAQDEKEERSVPVTISLNNQTNDRDRSSEDATAKPSSLQDHNNSKLPHDRNDSSAKENPTSSPLAFEDHQVPSVHSSPAPTPRPLPEDDDQTKGRTQSSRNKHPQSQPSSARPSLSPSLAEDTRSSGVLATPGPATPFRSPEPRTITPFSDLSELTPLEDDPCAAPQDDTSTRASTPLVPPFPTRSESPTRPPSYQNPKDDLADKHSMPLYTIPRDRIQAKVAPRKSSNGFEPSSRPRKRIIVPDDSDDDAVVVVKKRKRTVTSGSTPSNAVAGPSSGAGKEGSTFGQSANKLKIKFTGTSGADGQRMTGATTRIKKKKAAVAPTRDDEFSDDDNTPLTMINQKDKGKGKATTPETSSRRSSTYGSTSAIYEPPADDGGFAIPTLPSRQKGKGKAQDRSSASKVPRERKKRHSSKSPDNRAGSSRVVSAKRERLSPELPSIRRQSSSSSMSSRRPRKPKVAWPPLGNPDDPFDRGFVHCDVCEGWFHYGCVGIKPGDHRLAEGETFLCPLCEVDTDCTKRNKGDTCQRPNCNQPVDGAEDQGDIYYVQYILGRRLKRNARERTKGDPFQYLVKWDGYSVADATWENVSSMTAPAELIQEFHETAKKQHITPTDYEENGPGGSELILLQEAIDGGWLPRSV